MSENGGKKQGKEQYVKVTQILCPCRKRSCLSLVLASHGTTQLYLIYIQYIKYVHYVSMGMKATGKSN